jgi:glycosyltransferase involved in cell wall biosynthesis
LSRVLFLTESFHPILGGGESHIRTLAARLVAAGMPATVVTRRSDARWPAEDSVDGIRVLRVAPAGPARQGKYLMVPQALRALLRERRAYDVVIVRGTRVLGFPGLLLGRLLGKAVVLQAEVNGEMSGEVFTWGTGLDRPFVRKIVSALVAVRNVLLRDADAFVAMSRLIRDEFVAAGVAPAKIALLPHGIDSERFRPPGAGEKLQLRARLGLPADGVVITYTGRLLKGKGLETLVEAFAGLAPAAPAPHLLIVGSGAGQALSVEGALKADVEGRGLASRVTFTGRVENVEEYLRASDVFAFPSVFEALGLSLIEASATGLPCVGSRTGGIVDVIEDGVSGLLVAPGDVAALREALQRLALDPERRAALGSQGRAAALARFDLRASVEAYRALFEELSLRPASPSARAAREGEARPR